MLFQSKEQSAGITGMQLDLLPPGNINGPYSISRCAHKLPVRLAFTILLPPACHALAVHSSRAPLSGELVNVHGCLPTLAEGAPSDH